MSYADQDPTVQRLTARVEELEAELAEAQQEAERLREVLVRIKANVDAARAALARVPRQGPPLAPFHRPPASSL